jgi:cardiolipin synthase
MWHEFLTRYWLSWHGLIVVTGLLVYVGASRTLHQRRYPSAAIGWVMALLLIPYVALPLYLLFGTRKLVRRPALARPHRANDEGKDGDWPQRLAASMELPPAAGYRTLRVHQDGTEALQALREIASAATRTLDVCTFLIGRDPLGDEVCELLAARARAGVRVRLLLDGVGRYLGGYRGLRKLRNAGVKVAIFVPLIHSPRRGRTNLRNHRKMVIADGGWLWAGGRNLAAEYFEGMRGARPWHDLTFDLQGPLAAEAQDRFARDWGFATRTEHRRTALTGDASMLPIGQLIPSGPDQVYDTVESLLVTACFRAHRRILAVTPYFVPDEALLMALTLAARRGVDVDIVIPRRSNHLMADLARHRALRDVAGAGGRVWLAPQMNHAKCVVTDDTLAVAGSANLDARSLFLNYELMVAFYEQADVRRFAQWIKREREGTTPYVARRPGLLRDLSEGLVLWLAFQL